MGQEHARPTRHRPAALLSQYCRQHGSRNSALEQAAQVFPFRREQSTDFCQPKKQRPTLETHHHSASSLSVNL